MSESGGMLLTEEPSSTVTITEEAPTPSIPAEPTLRLRLKKPRISRQVQWSEDTVDNEGLGKKSSKCCCIYTKPETFEDREASASESDDDCEHCRGHVEKKKKKRAKHSDDGEENRADPDPASDPPQLPVG